ncbi:MULTISPECIES: WG repeat-containing protein [unclassified Streptomyces]|uniref:WG repeat-containing protein n=1 Tax=unclassified Streptomyces TaxID=2593676 RepID=UPI0035DDF024
MPSSTTAPPPYVVPCAGPDGSGTRYALVGADGRLVRAPELSAVGAFHPDGRGGFVAPAADLEGRCGYLDHRGAWLAEPALPYTEMFEDDGLSRFQVQDGRWGYAGTDGTPVIPATLTEAHVFRHGLAAARTEDGTGYIDATGRFVIRPQHAGAGPFAPNGLAGVRMADGGLCGYIDRTGRTVIEPRFDGARPFGPDGTAPVRVGDLWGLIDEKGNWIVEPSFRMFNPFAANGLAYVLGGTVGDHFRGFLNARGELVIKAESNRLSEEFRCGLVRFDNGYAHGYLDAAGEEVIEQEYEWAEDFNDAGAAVAHYLEPLDEDDPEEARAAAANRPSGRAWGVLRSDGRFIPVQHLEPLTDAGGWVLGFGYGTGLAAFVTRDGGVAHVDRDGMDVCRVEASADGAVLRLVNRAGTTLWETTEAEGTFASVEPAHCQEAHSYLVYPGAPERDVADLAGELLAAEPRPFEPCSLIFDSREDPYEPAEAEDDPDADGTSFGAMSVVAETFLYAEHQHDFSFLQDWANERFGEIEADMIGRLAARFGDPLPGAELCLRYGDGESSTVWQVGAQQLVLQSYFLVGDGDVEIQLWLAAVAPSDEDAQP